MQLTEENYQDTLGELFTIIHGISWLYNPELTRETKQRLFCSLYPAYIYLFKVINRNTRKRCVKCSELTIKTVERRLGIVKFEHVHSVNLGF